MPNFVLIEEREDDRGYMHDVEEGIYDTFEEAVKASEKSHNVMLHIHKVVKTYRFKDIQLILQKQHQEKQDKIKAILAKLTPEERKTLGL